MSESDVAIDELLAAVLRGEPAPGCDLFSAPGGEAAVVARIDYHGIGGLLRDTPGAMGDWPAAVTKRVRDVAVAQAMWELRHREILRELLGELAAVGILAIMLKGTAVAYDVYRTPATRDRGDSDILVGPDDLAETRIVLERLGFERDSGDGRSDDFCLQEVWRRRCDGEAAHHVDLHWQLLNSPALEAVLPVGECAASRVPLPRLGPDAWALDRVRTMIHTCIHRTLNFSSPYFVGDRTFYGGNRLIWLHDIHLLAAALSPADWQSLSRLARNKGVAAACLDGLLAAQRFLGTPLPQQVLEALGAAPPAQGASAYLRSRQLGRAWQDLRAIRGSIRKIAYLRARTLPSPDFVRDKYPQLARLPLPLLYARRLLDLVRPRPAQGTGR